MSEHKRRRNTHNTESYPRAFRESGTGWFVVEVIRVGIPLKIHPHSTILRDKMIS